MMDLGTLGLAELESLAGKLRHQILAITANNGGHLATNLGAVELTIALHRVLRTPTDKIFWDVGNQCYAHKMLTDRSAHLDTIRQQGGLSGFVNHAESPHDPMTSGHAGTALSSAIGLASARKLRGEDYRIAAVVGDGSLSSGLAYEALNNLSLVGSQLLVILNDNGFAISPSIGGMADSLKRMRERALDDNIFEQMGVKYFGPIDGHNLGSMIETIQELIQTDRPAVLHVVTQKGKGFKPAEDNPVAFHSSQPFELDSGKPRTDNSGTSYSQFFGEELIRIAKEDSRVVALTAAMPAGTGLSSFAETFPDRFFDVGIAEQHAVTMAAGLALGGCRPVVAIYSTFLQRAYDQIIHDVCLQNLPVTFVLDRAGLIGADGPTHHGAFDLSYLRAVPGMTVMAPKNLAEFAQMLRTAIAHSGPIAIRIPRSSEQPTEINTREPLVAGKAEVLREGHDVGLLAIGSMVALASEVADKLATQGVSAQVINTRSIKPLDAETILNTARNVRAVFTLEENAEHGGFGSAVAELLAEHGVSTPLSMKGLPDEFIQHGDTKSLLAGCGFSVDALTEQIIATLQPEADSNETDRLQIDPDECRVAIQGVMANKLPDELEEWVVKYDTVGERDTFLWKWCWEGVRLTALPCVDETLRIDANVTKVLGVMLDVLLDDIADQDGRDDFLDQLLLIPWAETPPDLSNFSPEEQQYAEMVSQVWTAIETRMRTYPRFAEFEAFVRYDYQQLFNAMRYSHLLNNHPWMMNLVEHDLYLPHNMHMMISGTIDCMCSSKFDKGELGPVREMLWLAQNMGRIGNLVTTWERELGVRDFTSGVFALALERGLLTYNDLQHADEQTLKSAIASQGVEQFFLDRWHKYRRKLNALSSRIRSIDVLSLSQGLERLIKLHLGSRGLK